MLETIKYWDSYLFLWLNGKHNAFFDFVMYWASNKLIWIPLYAFFLYLVIKNFKRNSIWILLTVVILIFLSDQFTVVIKNHFQRLRPCHQPELEGLVHLVKNYCGGQYGFVSSHASNHFALATFLSFLFRGIYRHFTLPVMLWAAFIAYSRIYLGAHYPGDVLAGAVIGFIWGFIFGKVYLFVQDKTSVGKS